MQTWTTLILALQILTALTMIGLVLVQHGKGADMGASFGSGASGSLFGATGSANFLSRATAACATLFFCCTLALAYLSNGGAGRSQDGGSVLDRPALGASAPTTGVIPGPAGAASPAVPAPISSTSSPGGTASSDSAAIPAATNAGNAPAAAPPAAQIPAPAASR